MLAQLKNPQTFRVFFSSPFKGMEEEREELTKKYFPQIQHKCAEMGLQFVAVDMRWGITTEASDNAQTVNICLREIDRSDMFVCFFGQRYGWHQSAGHTDGLLQQNIDSALGKYPWLDNYRDRSVTELELLHGHLNNPGVLPSCVLFRDKQYDDAMLSVRKEKAVSYTIENDEAQEKLDNLKKKVAQTKEQALALYFDYPNPLEGARLMFEEVMKYLENNVLTQNVEISKREREFAPHKAFMASRTSQYAGKPEDFDTLDQKLKPPDSDQPQESPHMLVLGPAGSGKSALICNWLQERVAKQPDVLVVPYFIGCAPSTRNPEELLGFVYTELEYQLGDVSKADKNTDSGKDYGDSTGDTTKPPEKPESSGEGDRSKTPHAIPNGDGAAKDSKSSSDSSDGVKAKEPARPKGKELQRAILKQLERAVETGKTVLLVFDAVNRLVAPSKTSKHLYWLPEKLPLGVVCVVSTDETDQATLDILLTQRKYSTLKLLPLDEAVQRDICVQTLNHSGKELSEQQLSTITKAQQTANPLFLKTVLAELSIFGSFRQLDSKIKSLISVASIKELLHNCLERLEADYNVKEYNGNLVGEILAALEVSREGLTETQIMNIFNIHSHTWSPLCFAMEYFTISHRGKLGFAISEFKDAVRERYLQSAEEEMRIREKLIQYFDGIRKGLTPWTPTKQLCEAQNAHAMSELIWLQKAQGDREGLIRSLSDLSVFIIMDDEHDLDLLELWQWTETKWRDVADMLLKSFDCAVASCYLLTQEGALGEDKSPGARMRVCLAHMRSFFDLVMHFPGVERALEREIRILENTEGKMDEEKRKEFLRDARYYRACNYSSMDLYREAREAHEANLVAFEKDLAEKEDLEICKQIAYTNNGLGIVYMNMGEYDKAIKHLILSAEFHKNNKDKKNEASAYTNLGLVYMYKQELDKALEYDEKALEAYEEGCFGQMPLEVGNLFTNMALIYRRKKNLDKAEEVYLKSLQTKANAVGWEHPVIATAFMNLGTLEMHRRNYAKAEEWTRKAIAIYEVNEFEKTKKEFRRCRENLFANMLKQNKMKEVMPLYIEIFDVLKQHGWLDECLAGMHRQVVTYMIENNMYDKAEEVSMALIDSPKVHPQNHAHLFCMDMERPIDQRPVRPYEYTLEAAMDKFPDHSMFNTLCEIKMENQLLPEEDKEGIQKLVERVALRSDKKVLEVMALWLVVADELKKTELLFDVFRGMVEENPKDKQMVRMFLRLCVHMGRAADAAPYLENFFASTTESSNQGQMQLSPSEICPERSRLDVGLVLAAVNKNFEAKQFLTEVSRSASSSFRDEAQAALDMLPT